MTEQTKMSEQHERTKNYASIRMTVSLTPVIFPIDFGNLNRTLDKRGYELTTPMLPTGIGQRTGGAGTLAKKGNISVVADSQRRFIGIDGVLPSEVLLAFDELVEVVKEDLWVDVHAKAAYYETIIRLDVLGHKSPTEVVTKFFQDLAIIKPLEAIIGEPTSLYTIRLVPKGQLTGEANWFDIRIEPDALRSDNTYMIEVVYRKTEYGLVKDFVSRIEQSIDAILDQME